MIFFLLLLTWSHVGPICKEKPDSLQKSGLRENGLMINASDFLAAFYGPGSSIPDVAPEPNKHASGC